MNRIANFEKISYGQFISDQKEIHNIYETGRIAGLNNKEVEIVQELIWKDIKLPERSTEDSAGYDFRSTANFVLEPGGTIVLSTGIRCKIDKGWVLVIVTRSGLGFKYRAVLANTIGVIDGDYYNSDNEGHIKIKICNDGDKRMEVKEGDKICQGLFFQYGITKDDNVTAKRNGGFGSTGK